MLLNYELLGKGDTHLHWHLFSIKSGDIENYGTNAIRRITKVVVIRIRIYRRIIMWI